MPASVLRVERISLFSLQKNSTTSSVAESNRGVGLPIVAWRSPCTTDNCDQVTPSSALRLSTMSTLP